MEYSANDESEEGQETVTLVEWIWNSKKPVTCPFGKKEPESYGFDITKADKMFDLLLSEGAQAYEVLQVAQCHIA